MTLITAALTRPADEDDWTVNLGSHTVRLTHPGPQVPAWLLTDPAGQVHVFASITEMALALHHADQPLSRALTADQVAALMLAGLRRQYSGDQLRDHEWDLTPRQTWGGARRAALCNTLAHRVAFPAQVCRAALRDAVTGAGEVAA